METVFFWVVLTVFVVILLVLHYVVLIFCLCLQSISILFYVYPQQSNIRQEKFKIKITIESIYIRQQLQQQHYMELIRLSPASGFYVPRHTHQVGWRARWRVDLRVERVEAIC